MKLVNPITGTFVFAEGEVAKHLIAHGYKPAEEPKKPKKDNEKKED